MSELENVLERTEGQANVIIAEMDTGLGMEFRKFETNYSQSCLIADCLTEYIMQPFIVMPFRHKSRHC